MKPRVKKTILLFAGMLLIGGIVYFFSVETGVLVDDNHQGLASPCLAEVESCQ